MEQLYIKQEHRWIFSSERYSYVQGWVFVNNQHAEMGRILLNYRCVPLSICGNSRYVDIQNIKVPIYWNNMHGEYQLHPVSNIDSQPFVSKQIWNYPIPKAYNLSKIKELLPIFTIKTEVDEELKYLPDNLTIGIEYETSHGQLPWIECLQYGLVPLYDGSISGHEYVTHPLHKNLLGVIKQHFKLLNKYTLFDKDCSLHIHFGGFPITYDKINRLIAAWCIFQWSIFDYLPIFCYDTSRFKSNGKSYCHAWSETSLNKFYSNYTGNVLEDNSDFYLPNTFDEEEERKWEVQGRYYNMNIMHLISGDSHKTVEFRFLRPTTNYMEFKWYIMILAAFLQFVRNDAVINNDTCTVKYIINNIYPKEIANKLLRLGTALRHLTKIQQNHKDYAGIDTYLKAKFIKHCCPELL